MTVPSSIAIIGASAAGVSAAMAIRKSGYEGPVALYDADGNCPYERPPLSKSLTSPGVRLKSIFPESAYAEQGIDLRLGVAGTSLGVDRRLMLADGSSAQHDSYILATGVVPRSLAVPGSNLPNIMHLRDARDAVAIGECLSTGGPLAVVGGGFIGLELAAVARSAGLQVTVIESAPVPLLRCGGRQIAEMFQQMHTDRGVSILTSTGVERFLGESEVEAIVLNDGRTIPAAAVVVGIGVLPNNQLAKQAGAQINHLGIEVDRYGRSSVPWLWAAGDVTVRSHPYVRGEARLEHWDTAQRHGEAVGRSIVGDPFEDKGVPYVWSDQYEFTYQAFGRTQDSDQIILRDGATPEDFVAFAISDGLVHAVMGVGRPREVRAGRTLIERRVPVDVAVLRDSAVDLRKIVSAKPATDGSAQH